MIMVNTVGTHDTHVNVFVAFSGRIKTAIYIKQLVYLGVLR